MIYFAVIIIIFIVCYLNRSFILSNFFSKSLPEPEEYKNSDLINALLSLEKESLDELFKLYKKQYGRGASYYARRTYIKWKTGRVHPNQQTYQRFLLHLPKVMSYDLKCEVLRMLMKEYCPKDNYELFVSTDDWEEKLTPLVKTIIDKPYTATLPKSIEEKLQWLAEDDMQIAQNILRNSQLQEGKICISMLREEISEIDNMMQNIEGRTTIMHKLKLPYGIINLKIEKR